MLREGLEAALIVAIVLAYLNRIGRRDRFSAVWLGAGAALVISVVTGVVLFLTVGELEGDARRLAFVVVMLSAAALLTWMIFWMRRQARGLKSELHSRVDVALAAGSIGALAGVVFFGVLREGVETAFFFLAASNQSTSTVATIVGGAFGLLGGLALSYAFYRGSSWLDLRQFFAFSGGLILLFAAGLAARATSDLQILGAIPTFWYPIFDASSVAVLSTENLPGQILRGLFGWDPAPSIEETLVWLGYVAVVGTAYFGGLSPRRTRRTAVAA